MDTRTVAMPESPALPGRKLTVEDLDALPQPGPDEAVWYELHDGEVVVVSGCPSTPHGGVKRNLLLILGAYLQRTGLGEILDHPTAAVLDRHKMTIPDLQVILRGGLARIRQDAVHGAPDLVVEVLSPSTAIRDFGSKRRLYEAVGVREYWIADPTSQALLQLVLEGGVYRAAGLHTGNAVFRPAVLPDLEIRLAEVWPTIPPEDE